MTAAEYGTNGLTVFVVLRDKNQTGFVVKIYIFLLEWPRYLGEKQNQRLLGAQTLGVAWRMAHVPQSFLPALSNKRFLLLLQSFFDWCHTDLNYLQLLHGSRIGSRRSLRSPQAETFCDSMILWSEEKVSRQGKIRKKIKKNKSYLVITESTPENLFVWGFYSV